MVREVEAVELPDELLAIAQANAQQAAHQLPHHRRHRGIASAPLEFAQKTLVLRAEHWTSFVLMSNVSRF